MILGIFGAGGSGRLAVDFAHRMDPDKERWSDIIFIDDVVEEKEVYHTSVYRSNDILTNPKMKDNLEVVISLGNPKDRERVFKKLKKEGVRFATIIDPTAIISPSFKHGEGVIIGKAVIDNNVYVGDNTIIYQDACIGHDVTIGNNAIISVKTFIAGHCSIGNRVYMGPTSVMRDRLIIEDDCVISIGAVLFKSMKANKVAIGNPARILNRDENKGLFE